MKDFNKIIERINYDILENTYYGKQDKMIEKVLRQFQYNNVKDYELYTIFLKICVIDETLSTNLKKQNSIITLDELASRINKIEDFDERVKNGDPKLVIDIANVENNGKKVNLFSFATKYCAYHNEKVYGRDDYSIYDNAIKEKLPEFTEKNKLNKRITKGQIEKYRKDFDYKSFREDITNVMDEAKISKDNRNRRRQFDRALWNEEKGIVEKGLI